MRIAPAGTVMAPTSSASPRAFASERANGTISLSAPGP